MLLCSVTVMRLSQCGIAPLAFAWRQLYSKGIKTTG
jgi:hypothetical protein